MIYYPYAYVFSFFFRNTFIHAFTNKHHVINLVNRLRAYLFIIQLITKRIESLCNSVL